MNNGSRSKILESTEEGVFIGTFNSVAKTPPFGSVLDSYGLYRKVRDQL
jgi:hypothetical protein